MKSVIIAAILMTLTGCVTTDPLYKPAKSVAATILPEYERYVAGDNSLNDMEKSFRIMNSKSFRKMMNEYEVVK